MKSIKIQIFSHHKNGLAKFNFPWRGTIRTMRGICIFGHGIGFSKIAVTTFHVGRKIMYFGSMADW